MLPLAVPSPRQVPFSFINPWCPETATAPPHRRPWSPRFHLPTRSGPLPSNRGLRQPCWSSHQQQVGQHWLPLDFYSKKLSKNEVNYSMFDSELYTVIAGIKPICSRLENRTLPVVDRPQTAPVRPHQGDGDNTTPAQACAPTLFVRRDGHVPPHHQPLFDGPYTVMRRSLLHFTK